MSLINGIKRNIKSLFSNDDGNKRSLTYWQTIWSNFGKRPDSTYDMFYKYYKRNSDLRGCILQLQETIAKGGWNLKKDWEVVQNQKIEKILQEDFPEVYRTAIRDLILTWNCYIEIVRNGMGEIAGFDTLDPRTMCIVANKHGQIIRYFQRYHGEELTFQPENLMHLKLWKDIDNEIFWMWLVEWLVIDILSEDEAALSNYYYFKNNAIPTSLVILEENLSEDEMKQKVKQMRDNFSGAKNNHKMWVLNWVKDIKRIRDSIQDMEFMDLRDFTTSKICAAVGVPKSILWYTEDVNYSNWENQYQRYIENTIRPWEERIEEMTQKFINKIDDSIDFEIKDEHIDNNKEQTEILTEQVKLGMKTVNEARQEMGMETFDGVPEADMPIIQKNFTRLEDLWLSLMNNASNNEEQDEAQNWES